MADWDATRFKKVREHLKFMFDLRKIEGEDVEIAKFDACPGFVWGVRRGDDWAAMVIRDISKQAATAVFDFCTPKPPEEGEKDAYTHPPVKRCVLVYLNKCTVIAGKEIEAYSPAKFEVFNLREILLSPFAPDYQDEYTLLDDAEAEKVKRKYNREGMAQIWTTDPVQRWFGAPVGSIYRIVERWGLHPTTTYRVVTSPNS